MFSGCSSLNELNLSNINTKRVTSMSCMFEGCSSLKELNLSNFDMYNVNDMNYMFYGCSSLKELILFNLNTNRATNTNMNHIFVGVSVFITFSLLTLLVLFLRFQN